jgi:hypothetical protein
VLRVRRRGRRVNAAIGSQSGVFVVPRVFDRRLFHIRRRWQVWMRAFRICGCGFDVGPGGADSLLDFLLARDQWIVRDVQRALLDFGFDYAVQRFDRICYLLLVSEISELVDFDASDHCFAQTRIGWVRFVLHAF